MNTFEKSQAAKILATYMAPEELEDLEKGHPVGHINAHGKQKQADGSWKYVGKKKAEAPAKESKTDSTPDSVKETALAAGAKELDKNRLESISRTREKFLKIQNPSESQIAHMDKLEAEEQEIHKRHGKKSNETKGTEKDILDELGLDKIKGGSLHDSDVTAEFNKTMSNFKTIVGKFDASLKTHGVRKGEYGHERFLARLEMGSGVDHSTKEAVLSAAKKVFGKYNYSSNLYGESRIETSNNAKGSSITLTMP